MASLVVPNLPEATPKLAVPSKPATLLPGLEESQGALYEIGVSDDGTFVGLAGDELDESLANLEAMAASLGCVVDVLRKVVVGHCEWSDLNQPADGSSCESHADNLWVAEALVRPDLKMFTQPPRETSALCLAPSTPQETLNGSGTQQPEISRSEVVQLRVSLIGATTSGKSSLLGTLTTSTLDNGRGKSRLNLLKHRHEIASGVTSSVAQELIGYHKDRPSEISEYSKVLPEVINYASENVSSWNDMHASAARLVFLSDSPGLSRYSKSTIRTLVSWKPHWTIICVAADCGEEDPGGKAPASILSASTTATVPDSTDTAGSSESLLMHLELCLKLDLPIIVAVTKMDVATKFHLRQTLSKLLSVLKAAGKKPVLTSASDRQAQSSSDQAVDLQCISVADEAEVKKVMKIVGELGVAVVPIILTSSVTGEGIGMLHGLLRSIPVLENTEETTNPRPSSMHLQEQGGVPSKIFQVDEIFTKPPSKVYTAFRTVDVATQGIVLCGYVSSHSICVGDTLSLGPFLVETNSQTTARDSSLRRTISFPNPANNGRPRSQVFSKSIPAPGTPSSVSTAKPPTITAMWQLVRVVSLRYLRLPTRSLLAGQVGTIGVEAIIDVASTSCDLRRARKGMILASFGAGEPAAYRSFTALFPAADFKAQNSPPLILGGHATIYVNSVRSAVRVTSVALAEDDNDTETPSRDNRGIFAFDGDEHGGEERQGIRIKFKFLGSVEWMRVDDRVLVVPNAAAVGPITGGTIAATGGLQGFVGRVCDLSD